MHLFKMLANRSVYKTLRFICEINEIYPIYNLNECTRTHQFHHRGDYVDIVRPHGSLIVPNSIKNFAIYTIIRVIIFYKVTIYMKTYKEEEQHCGKGSS